MADCVACDRPIHDVAWICAGCSTALRSRLTDAALLWGDVEVVITRQTSYGDPTPRAGRPAPAEPVRPDSGALRHYADQVTGWPTGLPVDLAASETAAAARNTLTTWARHIAAEVGDDPPASMPALTRWLAGRLDWARYQQWAPEAWDELGYACGLLWRVVDRPVPRVDAGLCWAPTDGGYCQERLSARPGAATIGCRGCGASWDMADRRRTMLAASRDHRGSATECARWLTWLGLDTTPSMVRGLAHRRRITADGHGRYRLGDVEDLRRETIAREDAA